MFIFDISRDDIQKYLHSATVEHHIKRHSGAGIQAILSDQTPRDTVEDQVMKRWYEVWNYGSILRKWDE